MDVTLAYRGPGEIFGELVMIDGGPREEMAEAMENALITEIERAEFEKSLRPALHNNVVLFGSHGTPAWGRLRQMGVQIVDMPVTQITWNDACACGNVTRTLISC